MNLLNNYSTNFMSTNQERTNAEKEQFKISNVGLVGNKFNITVQNTGSVPINITRLYVQNTTATDWFGKYSLNVNIPPTRSVSNIGTNIPLSGLSAISYDMKFVTSRGNTQQFSVNSVRTAPLLIQLIASPPSVASGFKSQLIMTVTNNQSGTITNLVPHISLNPGNSTTCVADQVIPSSYNTLPPGSTAIFTAGVKVTGNVDAQTCTYEAQLANGYAKNNANATITVNTVNLSSTTYAANSGVISDSYTTFSWTQGGLWHNHWQFPSGTITDFKITIQNNNATTGNYNLWLSKNTQIYLLQTSVPSNGKIFATPFFLTDTISSNPSTPPSLTAYDDYSKSIANAGGLATLYFGASAAGGSTQQTTSNLQPGTYFGFVLVYGKFAVNSGDNGSSYAQALPFLAVVMS